MKKAYFHIIFKRIPRKWWNAVAMLLSLLFINIHTDAQRSHPITFCGEQLPLNQDFVQNKMMNVIRQQVNVVNLPALRKRANTYMPLIQKYLAAYGLHSDLKYIPIVESGFITSAESGVGAKGFWQIMPATAKGYGLSVQPGNDERENFDKSTRVACQLIKDNYNTLKKLAGFANWPLAIAAYNFGIGNIINAVKQQGGNYFTMNLNKETGLYVYKIIAVKELWEYPEIYNSKYGFNIFSDNRKVKGSTSVSDDEIISEISTEVQNNIQTQTPPKEVKEELVMAHIEGNMKKFEDGDLVTIVLDEDLQTAKSGMSFKGYSFGVQGWVVDDRVYFNLGYGHDVTLLDTDMDKGILLSELKLRKKVNVVLKTQIY